jgi:hypothetical protein
MKTPFSLRNPIFLQNARFAKAPMRARLSATIREMLKAILPDRLVFLIRKAKVATQRRTLVQVPTVPQFLDVLHDDAFQDSLREMKHISQFDTSRLANLWQLCRMSEPRGTIVEVGVFRGGTSLHLMNCRPEARFIAADTFRNVADPDEVVGRLQRKGKDLTVLRGVFPDSDLHGAVKKVTFAHIDVVLYESCRRSLDYIAARCMRSAIIVVNDAIRHPWGVTEALCEFQESHPEWLVLPLYPGQAVAIRRDGQHPLTRLSSAREIRERVRRHRLPTFGTKAEPLSHFCVPALA